MKTIIFDFDGTIGDTQRHIVECMKLTLNYAGLPIPEESKIVQLIGLPLDETFRRLTDLDAAHVDELTDIYRKHFNDTMKDVQPFPHVVETMKRLRENGFIIAVASSRGHHSLQTLLDRFGILQYVSLIMGNEDVVEKKPAPEMVLKILDLTDAKPSEALVVGDAVYDIEMGQRAGCLTCGVSYGNNSREQLRQQGADYIIDDFADILEVINKIFG